jgi:alkanesulfonate monooxygenase SsuD/methylene tetrahydromethanopterin reductase-like flavin-dependent oxidoreductase (luciferase family)
MHGLLIGADEDELRSRAARLAEWQGAEVDVDEKRRTWIAGTPDEIVARLREYEAVGIERVMVQHLLHRDVDALELLAAEVVPAFA